MTDTSEFWETAFTDKQLMWGLEPARSATLTAASFDRAGVRNVLIPGVGYGRNATPFLQRGMSVTGIEVSETAIALARSRLGLEIPIHHGSVAKMPFDDQRYDGVFCYGLLYLFDAPGRDKLVRDCHDSLTRGGCMTFTVISKAAPMYGRGPRLGEDWYEIMPGVRMYFYDSASLERELGPYGLVELTEVDEPTPDGGSLPFIHALCHER